VSLNNGLPEPSSPFATKTGSDDTDTGCANPMVPVVTADDDPGPIYGGSTLDQVIHGWPTAGEQSSPSPMDAPAPDTSQTGPDTPSFSAFFDDDDNGDGGLATTMAGNTVGNTGSGTNPVTFTVSVAGSGLVFNNTITAGFSQAFENCIILAEQTLAQNWGNSVTLNISFAATNQGNTGGLASNSFYVDDVSYATLRNALAAHEQGNSYGQQAAASLPLTDPNPVGGTDWALPEAYARMLGLGGSAPSVDDTVSFNTYYSWNYGQDVANTLIHEITEGAMGRIGGLGDQNSSWSTMDLFRFNGSGSRDYTDGRDGSAAYFSYNGGQWRSSAAGLSFNNEYASGKQGVVQQNAGDTADWNQVDVFGAGAPGETNTLSQTDLQLMDVLGWTPVSSTAVPSSPPPVPAATTADMLTQDTGDHVQIYDIGNNQILQSALLTQLAGNFEAAGLGGFNGSDTSDLILRDTTSGNLQIDDISNNALTGTAALGKVGLDWQVSGFGQFSGTPGETDMIMRNTGTGSFQYYDIRNNGVAGAGGMGNVGLEWQVLGFGRFAGNANETDMIMRDAANGNLEFYNIVGNQVVGAAPGGNIGTDWQMAGVGDFSTNPNETDLLMRASNGDFEIFDISHDQFTGTAFLGNVGDDWQPVGFSNFTGNANETDMLMRQNSTGALEYYDIRNNAVVAAGGLGNSGNGTEVIGVGVLHPTTS
jgi:hypothetical protein